MDLINVLQRLNAISEESNKKPDDDNDGVPNWADKKPGADDTDDKEDKKANEDIMNVMRGLKAIQETEEAAQIESLNTPKLADIMGVDAQQLRAAVARASAGKQTRSDVMLLSDTFVKLINMPDDNAIQAAANLIKSGNTNKPDMEEGNEFSGAFNECGDMPMDMGAMSPLSMTDGGDETDSTQSMGAPTSPEAKDRYTLSITKADGTTLNATTDVPNELAALMKAVGMSGKAAVAPAQQGAEEVEEEFGNTPDATNERDPRSHGQTKDWGLPGKGAGKPEYPGTRASGDNPMSESMFKEYLKFKSGK
jgi:hypothetical protein